MDEFRQTLRRISGGRVLDVATRDGGFIKLLIESLKDYTEIVGIDIDKQTSKIFEKENINFSRMNAADLKFDNDSFDMVCISNSLHHLSELSRVLNEMMRVLKPGGYFIISEMYRDNQDDTQLTHVYLHNWCARIDTALGVTHNQTFTRDEIIAIAKGLDLDDLTFFDYSDANEDAFNKKAMEKIEKRIEKYLDKIKNLPEHENFYQQSRDIRRRLYDAGIQSPTCLAAVGRKND